MILINKNCDYWYIDVVNGNKTHYSCCRTMTKIRVIAFPLLVYSFLILKSLCHIIMSQLLALSLSCIRLFVVVVFMKVLKKINGF